MIFNIQRYSTHDGSGIRTVIFLKDCSLGCRWCQSPESRVRTQNLLYGARLYLKDCEPYAKTAPKVIERALSGLLIHRERLAPEHLTALTGYCLTQALTVCGEVKSVEETITTVLRDKPFCDRSGGGLTPSDGGPFMQPEMAMALLQASHETSIHTTVETYLHVPWKYVTPSLPCINLFLANLEHVADAPFGQWTDGNAARVLNNLRKLAAVDKRIVIRVPLIQGFNADETSIKAITDFAADELHASEIHFLPYHTPDINKYHLLNLPYDTLEKPLDAPELLDFARQYACQKRLTAALRR